MEILYHGVITTSSAIVVVIIIQLLESTGKSGKVEKYELFIQHYQTQQ